MRRMLTLVAGSAVLAATAALATGAGDTAREITDLDAAYQRAVATADTATIDRLLLDDFVLITSGGRVRSKRDVLLEIAGAGASIERNVSHDVRVRVHGDTAVVTAVLEQKGAQAGRPFDVTLRYTDTWVRGPQGWRQLSGHASGYQP